MCHRSAARRAALVLMLAGLVTTTAHAAGGKPTRPAAPGTLPDRLTPRQLAEQEYDRGLELRDEAVASLEKAAAEESARRRAKHDRRAEKKFRRAAEAFREAVRNDPDMYQAYSSLGFALRNLGELDSSLLAYDRALQLRPDYAEAAEYRAEAYLGLGRLDEVREAYMDLFRREPLLAASLLRAMKAWIAENPDGLDGMAREELDAFVAWVGERERLAGQLGDSPSSDRGW